MTGEPRSATIVAQSDGVLFEITKAAVQELLQREPSLLQSLSEIMAARIQANGRALQSSLERAGEGFESLPQMLLRKMRQFFLVGER